MSIKLKLLNQIQQQRKESGEVCLNAKSEESEEVCLNAKSKVAPALMLSLIFGAVFLILLIFNIKLWIMLKGYASQKSDELAELASISRLIRESTNKVDLISVNLEKKIESGIKDIHADIRELREAVDAQAFASENLSKAKDALFKRISALEAKTETGP